MTEEDRSSIQLLFFGKALPEVERPNPGDLNGFLSRLNPPGRKEDVRISPGQVTVAIVDIPTQ